MALENPPTLPDAHQQIRLAELQASTQKWTAAIEHYSRAIEYFKAIQNILKDNSLVSMIQAQIVQCEKTIHFYRLKDRSEQAIEERRRHSKIPRAHSVSHIKPPTSTNRAMTRHNTVVLENKSVGQYGMDSLAALMFSNSNKHNTESSTKAPSPMMAKKTKDDSQKMEELQMSNEALKNYLKAAIDDIERLKYENNELRTKTEGNNSQQQVEFGLLPTNHEDMDEEKDQDESENELQNTI